MIHSFSRESVQAVSDEAWPLMRRHAEEVSDLGTQSLDPDLEKYRALEAAGAYAAWTAREDGRLFGYSGFLVIASLHYPKILMALQDVVYIEPERRGPAAVKFILFVDEELKAMGVERVIRTVTERKDYSRTLTRMGYTPIERVFVKQTSGKEG